MDNILSVSQTGVDVRTATGDELIFSSQYPFAKLDKTNTVSFQNFTILFNKEPPNPSGSGSKTTLLYQFAHGYKYVPSTWFLMQHVDGGYTSANPIYQQEGGVITQTNPATYAIFTMNVDTQNCYFYITKFSDGTHNVTVQGIFLNIRVYVFAGDLSGTVAGS